MLFKSSLACIVFISSEANSLDSIMFTSTEVALIKAQRQAENLSQYRKLGCIICHGILYVNNDKWTVWLNDKMISSQTKFADIHIHKVTANMVSLTWRYKGKDHTISLRPQQEYYGESLKLID
jgi:hypothetical protein